MNNRRTNAQLLKEIDQLKAEVAKLVKFKSEEKDAFTKLRESEEKFRIALKGSNTTTFTQDLQLKYTWVYNPNPNFSDEIIREMIGKTDYDLVPKEDAEILIKLKQNVIDNKKGLEDVVRFTVDGKVFYYQTVLEPIFDNDGNITGISGASHDITDRNLTEEKLHDIEASLKNMFDISPGLICVANVKTGYFTQCNPAVKAILGISVGEFTSMPFMDFVHPDDRQKTVDEITKQLKGSNVANFENRYQHKDGSYKWLAWQATAADKGGKVYAVATDITGSKRAKRELEASEVRYRSLVSILTSVIWVTDAGGQFVEPQHMFEEFTGQPWEEHRGLGWTNMIHPDDREKVKELWTGALKNKSTYYSDGRMMRANGKYCYFEAVATPIFDDQGKLKEWVGTITDITERKQVEVDLRESEANLNIAQKLTKIGSWELDLIKNKLTWSDEVYRMFGLEPQQFGANYESFLENIHQDDRELVNKAYVDSLVNKKPYSINHRLKLKDGTIKYVNEVCETTYDDAGKAVSSVGTVQDITELKLTEKKLIESESKYRRLTESNVIGVIFWNTDGDITEANDEFLRMVGYTREEVISGKVRWVDMTPPEYARADELALKELATTGILTDLEKEYIRKDGSRVPILLGAAMLEGSKKEGICYVLDLTERKNTEEELKKYREHLEGLVEERTKELKEKNKELDNSMRVFVGREQKIIELENRIKELRGE